MKFCKEKKLTKKINKLKLTILEKQIELFYHYSFCLLKHLLLKYTFVFNVTFFTASLFIHILVSKLTFASESIIIALVLFYNYNKGANLIVIKVVSEL